MDERFDDNEELLRAVWPAELMPLLWNGNRLASAAFKDKKGLSVDRTYNRTLEDSIKFIRRSKHGFIFSISVNTCNEIKADVKYRPSKDNPYHSEIHGSETRIELNEEQAFQLSRKAVMVSAP